MKPYRPPVQDVILWDLRLPSWMACMIFLRDCFVEFAPAWLGMDPRLLLHGLAGPPKAAFGHCPAAGAEVFASAAPRDPVCPCCAPGPGCLQVCCSAHRAPLHLLTLALGTARGPGRRKGQKAGRKEALDKTHMTILGKWPCHQCWSVIFVLGKLCVQGELHRASGRLWVTLWDTNKAHMYLHI